MNSKTLLAITLCSALCVPAIADPLIISTGSEGRTYDRIFGTNLATILTGEHFEVIKQQSEGSWDNLERCAKGTANFCFSQADAYALYISQYSSAQSVLKPMAYISVEAVFLAVRKDGPVKSISDLISEKSYKVNVGFANGGAIRTWQYIVTLNPKYKNATIVTLDPTDDASQALLDLEQGKVDAVLWVETPNLSSNMIKIVQARDSLRLVDTDDSSLKGKMPDGNSVYDITNGFPWKINSFLNDKVDLLTTRSLVFANKKTPPDALKKVAARLALSPNVLTTNP